MQRLVRVQEMQRALVHETQRFDQESPSLFPHSHPVPGRWRWTYLTATPLPRSRSFVRHRRGPKQGGAEMSSRPGTAREPDPSLSPAATAFLTVPAKRPASVSARWQLCFCALPPGSLSDSGPLVLFFAAPLLPATHFCFSSYLHHLLSRSPPSCPQKPLNCPFSQSLFPPVFGGSCKSPPSPGPTEKKDVLCVTRIWQTSECRE
ncbi:uncharacterized protein LOC113457663 [Microtus ochrogaster]|uniref:Uncharacterized protein LOC113457663 n=1 Tax=Microtus ochrogaster TaxID=79684 RepID=A0ABM1UJF5_MICOH|nr:uncharacterized protein LOC113457663 [Microtus ochrogaster]